MASTSYLGKRRKQILICFVSASNYAITTQKSYNIDLFLLYFTQEQTYKVSYCIDEILYLCNRRVCVIFFQYVHQLYCDVHVFLHDICKFGLISENYRVFDNDRYKVWAYCSDQKASLELKTGGNISLSLVHLHVKLRKRNI